MTVLPTRPLLRGLYHAVALDADRIQVCNAGRSVVLAGDGLAERVVPLLGALDGTSTLAELSKRFPDLAVPVLQALAAKRLLTEASRVQDAGDGAAGKAATALAGELCEQEVAERIAGASVAVAGCGAVGTAVAMLLGKAGVGHLILFDPEAPSHLDPALCPVLPASGTGETRAAAAAAVCRAASRARCTIARRDPEEALTAADLAILERPWCEGDAAASMADRCLSAGTPYLLHGGDALLAVVGPLVRRGGAPCHHCAEVRRRAHVAHLDEHLAYLRHRARVAPRPDVFLAAHAATVAGVAATEALRALAGAPARTRAATFVWDLEDLSLRREEILAVPGCSGCAQAPEA